MLLEYLPQKLLSGAYYKSTGIHWLLMFQLYLEQVVGGISVALPVISALVDFNYSHRKAEV